MCPRDAIQNVIRLHVGEQGFFKLGRFEHIELILRLGEKVLDEGPLALEMDIFMSQVGSVDNDTKSPRGVLDQEHFCVMASVFHQTIQRICRLMVVLVEFGTWLCLWRPLDKMQGMPHFSHLVLPCALT